MGTDLVVQEKQEVELTGGSVFLSSQKFDFAWRIAKALASSQFVPANFRGKPEDCLIALDLAARLNMPPTMLLQNCYVVHGRVGMESKFLIALFNATGKYSPMAYIYEGQRGTDTYSCHAEAKHLESGMIIKGPAVTQAMVKAEGWGSKWKTMPEVMFPYRAAAFFIRLHAPELAMGMYTKDELEDIHEAEAPKAKAPKKAEPVDYIEAEAILPKTEDPAPASQPAPIKDAPKTSNFEFLQTMATLKASIGEEMYYNILQPYKHSNEIIERSEQIRIYEAMKACEARQKADAEAQIQKQMDKLVSETIEAAQSLSESTPEDQIPWPEGMEPAAEEQERKHKNIACPEGTRRSTKVCEAKCPIAVRDNCQAYIDWYMCK